MRSGTRNRVAVVTGGASGIGLATAIRLHHGGHVVAVLDVDEVAARNAAKLIGGDDGSALAVAADVSVPADVDRAVQSVLASAGRIDVLVNSAGVAGAAAPMWEISVDEWDRVLRVNLSGTYYACRSTVPYMIGVGFGRIVNVASIAGKEGNPNAVAYSSSKAGVIGLTKALAKEVATSGVLVNCVTPAVIETPILKQLSSEHIQYMTSRIPMGRVGQPEEVASLIAWLCSEECSFSTGAVFDISGGRATY